MDYASISNFRDNHGIKISPHHEKYIVVIRVTNILIYVCVSGARFTYKIVPQQRQGAC